MCSRSQYFFTRSANLLKQLIFYFPFVCDKKNIFKTTIDLFVFIGKEYLIFTLLLFRPGSGGRLVWHLAARCLRSRSSPRWCHACSYHEILCIGLHNSKVVRHSVCFCLHQGFHNLCMYGYEYSIKLLGWRRKATTYWKFREQLKYKKWV